MLVNFTTNLFKTGKLQVDKEVKDFDQNELDITSEILTQYFNEYRFTFPFNNKLQYHKEAGLWAVTYVYRLCQALLIREMNIEEVIACLPNYTFNQSKTEVLSVDLVLQYIPQIFNISKELAPSDVLITEIKTLANKWSFSLFEIAENPITDYIENDSELLKIFAGNLIRKKHIKGITSEKIKKEVSIQLGDYKEHFWKDLIELEQYGK